MSGAVPLLPRTPSWSGQGRRMSAVSCCISESVAFCNDPPCSNSGRVSVFSCRNCGGAAKPSALSAFLGDIRTRHCLCANRRPNPLHQHVSSHRTEVVETADVSAEVLTSFVLNP